MAKKKLSAEYIKALNKARTSVIKKDVEFVESVIQAIYELGVHPTLGHPIQAGEFIIDKKVRNMIFSEVRTIEAVFGEVKEDGTLANIGYEDGIPKTLSIPDIVPNQEDQYWYTLPKK